MTIKIPASQLAGGMKIREKGRTYTVRSVRPQTVKGGGEFPDYTVYVITFEHSVFVPGRGKVPYSYQADPKEAFNVIETEIP